jgi:hypothetical protein
VLLLVVFAVLVPRVAIAACDRDPGNLLAGKADAPPAARLTDGVIAREGAPWPEPSVALALHGAVTWDIGRVERIGPVFVQGDADQPIDLETSTDGESWTKQSIPPHESATGMIGRIVPVRRAARFVRLSTPHPSGSFVMTEVIAACDDVPMPWSPAVRPAAEPDLAVVEPGASDLTPSVVDALKLVLVLAAIAAVASRRPPRQSLVAVAVLAALAYFDFGAFHRPSFVHEHDVFHYYVGARYFPELGYDALYDCAAAAEAEAGFTSRIELRAQRDLRTNALIQGKDVLGRGAECRARFTDERWSLFTRDVRSFASRRDVHDWHRVLKDHGFNATPAWIAASVPFSRWVSGPAAAAAPLVAALDPLLLVLAFAALYWAFGREITCLAIVAFACNPLSEFAWIGGAFLRQLWLAALLGGIALLARRRAAAAGVALALAALLQLFPIVCLASLAAAALVWFRLEKKIDPLARRALLSAALAIEIAAPASAWISGRPNAWSAFAENTAKHAATPSANLVGLPALLSFRPSTRADVLFDEQAVDPFARIRAARRENFAPLRPLHWIAALAAVVMILRSLRGARERSPVWWASALGIVLVPVLLETSSYYTSFLALAVVLAHERRHVIADPVPGAIAGCLVARLAGLVNDVFYAVASALVVVANGAVLVLVTRATRPAEEEPPA